MNRLLLTLLALLTGMVAQVSPATAAVRTGGETEIGASEGQLSNQVVASAAVGLARSAAVQPGPSQLKAAPVVSPQTQVRTVLTGIDRARE